MGKEGSAGERAGEGGTGAYAETDGGDLQAFTKLEGAGEGHVEEKKGRERERE